VSLGLLLVALGVIGAVAAVATGHVRGGLEDPITSRPYRPVPEGPVEPADVDAVRFSLAFRGYRMDEVDDVLRRLRDAIADRDAELVTLRRELDGHPAEPDVEAGP
jgi:DivIVA domain-containing protein